MAGTAIMPGEEGRQTRPGDDRERPARERERDWLVPLSTRTGLSDGVLLILRMGKELRS